MEIPYWVYAWTFILVMALIALVLYDWQRIWNSARRNGVIVSRDKQGASIRVDLASHLPEHRWWREYLGYKLWTWIVRVLVLGLAIWHMALALAKFCEFVLYLWEMQL